MTWKYADIFLAGAVAMANNFGAPPIMSSHTLGARAKLRVNRLIVD